MFAAILTSTARVRVAGAAAKGRLQLDAVIARWIVAGRDHHAAHGAQIWNGIRNHRCRSIGFGKSDAEALGRQHLAHRDGVPVGQEARVEADHDQWSATLTAPGCFDILKKDLADGLRHLAHVGKGEFIADDGSPAVRAELDCPYLIEGISASSLVKSGMTDVRWS